jgi:hypothetical protein
MFVIETNNILCEVKLIYFLEMPISPTYSWKERIFSQKELDRSNSQLSKIKVAVGPLTPFSVSFQEISKNKGISFLSLDQSETQLSSSSIAGRLLVVRGLLLQKF